MARPAGDPILVLQTTVPGTLRAFFRGQLEWLQRRGIKIHAVASPGPFLMEVAGRTGIAVHAVPMRRRITAFADLATLWRIVRLYRRLEPSIVHGFTPKGGLIAMVGAWIARRPVRVYTIFGLPYMTRKGAARRLLMLSERISCALAHRVFCECDSIRDVAVADRICPAGKIRVLPAWSLNTIRPDMERTERALEAGKAVRARLGIPDGAPVIGCLGRVARDKGIPELVDAYQILEPAFPELHLVLVGRYDDADPLPARTLSMITDHPRIHAVGLQEDIVPYLAGIDVLIHPSLREGLPTAPIEAAAMELPVVATRIPGNVDVVIDGVTGTLTSLHDPGALAQATRRYLDDPALRRAHGRAARERLMAELAPERAWEALYAEYRALMSRGDPVSVGGRRTPG